jgi:hypothetical protein
MAVVLRRSDPFSAHPTRNLRLQDPDRKSEIFIFEAWIARRG